MADQKRSSRRWAAFAAGVSLLACATGAALGDDRDLLRDSIGEPYVFILFDTSGSMHWTPRCTQEQINARECSQLCTTGDCYAPLQSDDPGSKFFQAKAALYEVLKQTSDIQFGFATYNQDDLHLRAKHWLYRAAGDGPDIPGWGAFPAAGSDDVFGRDWDCDTGNGDNNIGCYPSSPADLGDAWENARVRRYAKGRQGANADPFFVRHAGEIYQVSYDNRSGALGLDLVVRVTVELCPGGNCASNRRVPVGQPKDVTFRPAGEFFSWDSAADRTNPNLGFFSQGAVADPLSGNTCSGWDPNTDATSDRHGGYSVRWPTNTTDTRGESFYQGDVIPLDWKVDHKNDLLYRLAPNLALDPAAAPDFRTAAYFENATRSGEDFLRLKNEAARPLVASGSTPLGHSLEAFRNWWTGCPHGTCPKTTGWKQIAQAQDTNWSCRRKFLIVITDGDETCDGQPCSFTASLNSQEGIKTYVVAFGVESSGGDNKLTCMAASGGSGKPIYPQSKKELVKALSDILDQIREEASAFASAAVPSVQAEVADRIYLSSFTPLNGEPVWDGHLDAYLKPLPLTSDGRPDRARICPPAGSSQPRSSCFLWDAGAVLRTQARNIEELNGATVDAAALRLGTSDDQRRVFYAKAGLPGLLPRRLRLFAPPAGDPKTDPEWYDLWAGLGVPFADPAAAKDRTDNILRRMLGIKPSEIQKLDGTKVPIRYLLGDVFHSDPVIVDRPNDFFAFSANLMHKAGAACDTDPGYQCFAQKHSKRRKMLVVGSNDGQLHAFDAGVWDPAKKAFSDGTGKELFSFIPRALLPVVRELGEGSRQIFSMDATPRIEDVFLDPSHNGTPAAAQREWRTVLVGGYREGGSRDGGGRMLDFVGGYYALDITQPDQLKPDKTPIDQRLVPSCLALDNQPVTGCGPVPFPALLWEFADTLSGSRLDEDDNTFPDLGQTWSVPTIGRVRVVESGKLVDKFVAIFGGGMDAESKPAPRRGNWLYMVDIETGQAIYKRRLTGSAAADPAALDVDLDGYLDMVYIGTTAGYLYKVDLRTAPRLEAVTVPGTLMLPELPFAPPTLRVTSAAWEPFAVFSTLGRPIHFAPTLFYVAKIGRFALGFGTGDREDLWDATGQEGRFYVVIDENFTADQFRTLADARTENVYHEVRPGGAYAAAGVDYVLNPPPAEERGWWMKLEPNERVITQTFGLSGVLIFSTFRPNVTVTGTGNNGGGGNGGNQNGDPAICARGGESGIFVVLAGNGNGIMTVDGRPARFRTVSEFVTNPYVEQGATKNTPDSAGKPNSEQLDPVQKAILQELKKFFPPGTKFANYWISVSGIRSDTGYERYATIPVGIVERNWKEH